jgi:hypothetical protein
MVLKEVKDGNSNILMWFKDIVAMVLGAVHGTFPWGQGRCVIIPSWGKGGIDRQGINHWGMGILPDRETYS